MATEAPAKHTDRFFDQIAEGEEYTVEAARTITEADVVNFSGISGDFHPQHLSTEFAAETDAGRRIAHGNLIFSITEGLIAERNRHSISYGYDHVRFVNPTFIGDTLTASREVLSTESYDDTYGQVVYRYEATKQDGSTVYVGDHIMMVEKE